MPRSERVEVGEVVVCNSVAPTVMDYTNPFEGEGSYGGVVGFAPFDLELIVGTRPEAISNGDVGELMKALADEFWAGPSPVDPEGITAALDDGGDAAVFLDIFGGGEAIALGTEGAQESRGKDRASAGETGEGERYHGSGIMFGWRRPAPE